MYVFACLLILTTLGCLRDEYPQRLGTSPSSVDIPARQGDLRVVTYNLYCWQACRSDFQYVKAWLEKVLPTTDVIAFQEFECWCGNIRHWLTWSTFGGKRFKIIEGGAALTMAVDTSTSVTRRDFDRIGSDRWGNRYVATATVQLSNGRTLKLANHHGCVGSTDEGCRAGGHDNIFEELQANNFLEGDTSIWLCDCNDMMHYMNDFCDYGFEYQKTKSGGLAGWDNIAWSSSGLTYMQAFQYDGRGSDGASDHQGLVVDFTYGGADPCNPSCDSCVEGSETLCASCPAGKVLVDGVCTEGLCQEQNWPDLDHNLVCGDCKVLVDNFDSSYGGTCSQYCASLGRQCTGAWDENSDSCSELSTMTCDQVLGSSDAICECGELTSSQDPVVPEPTEEPEETREPTSAEPTASTEEPTPSTVEPTSGGQSGGTPCCMWKDTNTCMPQNSQWWCNESSDNCLGACNNHLDKKWGVPPARLGEECWSAGECSGDTGGVCNFCGAIAGTPMICCREGWANNHPSCAEAVYETPNTDYHQCVLQPAPNCDISQAEEEFLMWNLFSCSAMQEGWEVCTTEDDPNHYFIMLHCPATCAMARGECGSSGTDEPEPEGPRLGEECWVAGGCGGDTGEVCDYCGTDDGTPMICCREGWEGNHANCAGAVYTTPGLAHHQCVLQVPPPSVDTEAPIVETEAPAVEDFCTEEQWPDLDHGLVCGDCKVLVDNFDTTYETCSGYCEAIGLTCKDGWEEVNDNCEELHALGCSQTLASSDALCECHPPSNAGTDDSCGAEIPASCSGHISWAQNTGRLTNPSWYGNFQQVTGVPLDESTLEDMTVFFACKDYGYRHEDCLDIEIPCGRSCGN